MDSTFSVSNTTKQALQSLSFKKIKEDILGTRYVVSLVFVGEQRAQTLNKTFRKKSYTPNVLAFEVDKNHGEIYITPSVAEKEAREYGHTTRTHIGFLFIHALLHLKGHAHGATMEKREATYLKKYKLS